MTTYRPPKKPLIERFFESLGGWNTLYKDKFLWAAVVLTVLLTPLWIHPQWWDMVIGVMSLLVGFSIGGLAVILSLLGDQMKRRIMKRSKFDGRSPFLMLNAAFTHYIITCFTALAAALLSKAWYQPQWIPSDSEGTHDFIMVLTGLSKIVWLVSGFLFCYSLTSGAGAMLYIYRLAETSQTVADFENAKAGKTSSDQPSESPKSDTSRSSPA